MAIGFEQVKKIYKEQGVDWLREEELIDEMNLINESHASMCMTAEGLAHYWAKLYALESNVFTADLKRFHEMAYGSDG